MGSCVSFSRSAAAASTAEERSTQRAPVATAKVVNLDGSMAQFAGPVTAREAMLALGDGGGRQRAPSPPRFLCGSDELGFDAPARALAADEALQPGQLYFVLPAPMLRRPLSGNDMAALAVRAATALAAEAGLAAGGGVMSPQRRRTKQGGAAGKGRRRRQSTARVAPLLVVSGNGKDGPSDGSWNNDTRGGLATREAVVHDGGSRTVGKARRGADYRSGARRRPGVQRLSAIAEDNE
ncbi:hypothetical protein SETIT_2G257300v2 [Setaria italica]|uniref:Uncharacterized protein n=1 Tax=Setaria italica TaxID=4555 RepID=A0A368Q368_SETIT|nr:uncharacterized protein LOC101778067 [Setaria italica]RCV12293.1 hypothetical protein SETIT_2G257300v2 [Setaria italica]